MPRVEDSIQKGPLSAPERAVLDVVTRNPGFVWSTSLEDLLELAKWATQPTSGSVPFTTEEHQALREGKNPSDCIQTSLDINTKVKVYIEEGREKDTYSLRTIMSALSNLHHTGRIWAYKMYKRTHYGSFSAENGVKIALARLSAEGQTKANFTPLKPEESVAADMGSEP
jgi:hypothetical protein